MKRTKHSLSHYNLTTCDMGKLVPLGVYEVLPGDSVQQHTSLLLRVTSLLAPVMHPVSVRVHHWFVPHRIVWEEWEDFITGGSDGLGNGAVMPTLSSGVSGFAKGSLADYFGIKPEVPNMTVNSMAFKAYNLIWNEFYRDQDLQAEAAEDNLSVLPVAWEKDYFTTCRAWEQKGPDVSLPLGVQAPVRGIGAFTVATPMTGQEVIESGGGKVTWSNMYGAADFGNNTSRIALKATSADADAPPEVYADLSQATAANVNEIRRAFALQRYQEARAMYGSRYTEYLRYLGVRSSDARLQRPEYLGGGKQTISFSEVLKTGAGEDPAEAIGTMKGHGIAALRSRRFRRFFEEHGHVITLLSVRPRTMYTDALHRGWSRRTKEDYFQRELERIGQQPVYSREVYAQEDVAGSAVFGYQDRYSEYRHLPSQVNAEFRELLNYWHLGRAFTQAPVLNASFVECDPAKRIYAEQTQHALWIMGQHTIRARRMVGQVGVGRII